MGRFTVFAMILALAATPPARAWDSRSWNPTRSTHTLITDWAIDELKAQFPELDKFREALVDGANTELHELPIRKFEKELGKKYKLDLEKLRVQHRGTNEGCDDIEGWWKDCLAAYKSGDKAKAYFLLGVVLHMVQDMGVPAHAHLIKHQGNLTEFDNFEYLALSNWKPKFDDVNRKDPGLVEPWKYYAFSQKWTRDDAPNYKDRSSFPKFWATASEEQRALVSSRQGRTCHLVKWTLNATAKALK